MADEAPALAAISCPFCGQANRVAARYCRAFGQLLSMATEPTLPAVAHPVADSPPALVTPPTTTVATPLRPEHVAEAAPTPATLPETAPSSPSATNDEPPLSLARPTAADHPHGADEPPLVMGGPPRRRGPGVAGWVAIIFGIAALVVVAIAAVVVIQLSLPRPGASGGGQAQGGQATAGPAATPAHANTMIMWDAGKGGDPKSYLIDGYTVTLSTQRGTGGPAPQLQVTAPDGRAFAIPGDPSPNGVGLAFGVGKLDPQGEGEQVFVVDFTGSAHCCYHARVLELVPGGWRVADVGAFEGDPSGAFPKDIDGDGVPDIVVTDDRFAYAFTDFAESVMPSRFYDIVGGQAVDVSAQSRYASEFRRALKASEAICLKHGNGGCAAMVAEAARLGLRDWAWRVMLANYDSGVTWDWPPLCRVAAQPGQCPPDDAQTFNNMPDALAAFLAQTGYVAPGAPAAPNDTSLPSFDCAGADQPATVLICNTPQLSQEDRALADAYQAALTNAADPDQVKADQKDWLARRAKAQADVATLSALYEARIQQLQEDAGE